MSGGRRPGLPLSILVRRTVRADELCPGLRVRNGWGEFVRVIGAHESGDSVWLTTADRDGLARLDPDDEAEVVVEELCAGR